jgi:Leucine-rich repeat (LRR) protein
VIVAGLAACCCPGNVVQPNKPGAGEPPGNQPVEPNVAKDGPAKVVGDDPTEQAAVRAVQGNGGVVMSKEGGKVVDINLHQPSVTDDTLKEFAVLTKLRKLRLFNSRVTGPGLRHLVGLPELVELDLSGSRAFPASGAKDIAALKHLRILDISGTKVTGAALKDLAPLTQLEELHATGHFNDTAAFTVADSLPNLKKLIVNNSQLGDAGLTEIAAKMPRIQTLSIHGTQITDKGLTALPQAKTLEELELSFSNITDNSAKIVSGCTNLRVLRLFNTRVTDVGLEFIGTLPQLRELDLHGNKGITIAALAQFIKTHPNCSVKQ